MPMLRPLWFEAKPDWLDPDRVTRPSIGVESKSWVLAAPGSGGAMPTARQSRVMAALALAVVGTVPLVGAFSAPTQASTRASCSSGWTVTSPPAITGALHAITAAAATGGN